MAGSKTPPVGAPGRRARTYLPASAEPPPMVDFQSRDTQRGSDDAEAAAEEAADEASSEPVEAEDDAVELAESLDAEEVEATEALGEERGLAVVTVADDRSIEEDRAGGAVVEEIERGEDHVVTRAVIHPSYDGVQQTVDALVDRKDVYGVVTIGGTGVEPDDVTVEAVRQMFAKELPGFGEFYRRACQDQAGTSIIRSRATAGILDGAVCFCLPGDTELARLGTREFVVPEAEYLAALAAEPEEEEEKDEDDA